MTPPRPVRRTLAQKMPMAYSVAMADVGGEDDAAAARTANLSNEDADGVLGRDGGGASNAHGRDGGGAEDAGGPPARKQAAGQWQAEDAREEEPVQPEDGGAELEGEL